MISVTFDETPEAIVERAAIHELGVESADVRRVVDLLERMGLGARIPELEWERDFDWITAGDDRVTVSVSERSGGLRYRVRPLADEPGTNVSTSAAALEEIARAWIERLGRPTEAMRLERITYLRAQTAVAGTAPSAATTLDAGLVFTRTVEDLPVIGPGGVAMVKIGTDETVVGGREVWRPIVRSGVKLALRGPGEAMNLLQTRLRKSGLDGEVHVRKARQGYAELGIDQRQRFLEPCYAFVIESAGGLVESKKVEVIPAARVGPMASAFARGVSA